MFLFNERKKEILTVGVCCILLFIIGLVIYSIFEAEINGGEFKQNIELLSEEVLPIPNRIIYKNSNKEYLIWNQYSGNIFSIIYSEMYNQMQNKIEGIVYTEDRYF